MNKKVPVLLALIALFVASMACNLINAGPAEMSLDNVRSSFDQEGDNPTTVFSPSDVFYVVGYLDNAPAGTVVEAKWLASQIEGYDSGELIYEQSINDFTDESFSGTIYFQLSNDSGWPVGEYKADIYLNGNFSQSVSFSVQ